MGRPLGAFHSRAPSSDPARPAIRSAASLRGSPRWARILMKKVGKPFRARWCRSSRIALRMSESLDLLRVGKLNHKGAKGGAGEQETPPPAAPPAAAPVVTRLRPPCVLCGEARSLCRRPCAGARACAREAEKRQPARRRRRTLLPASGGHARVRAAAAGGTQHAHPPGAMRRATPARPTRARAVACPRVVLGVSDGRGECARNFGGAGVVNATVCGKPDLGGRGKRDPPGERGRPGNGFRRGRGARPRAPRPRRNSGDACARAQRGGCGARPAVPESRALVSTSLRHVSWPKTESKLSGPGGPPARGEILETPTPRRWAPAPGGARRAPELPGPRSLQPPPAP